MNGQSWCAILAALALAAPVQAQNEPSLELTPLVPPKAPWLKKNQKKKTKKKKTPPAQMDVQPGAPFVAAPPSTLPPLPAPEAQLPLPPLVPLQPAPAPIAVSSLGVVLQTDGLDAASAATVEQGLREVVKIAPLTRVGPVLAKTAQPCAAEERGPPATGGAGTAEHPEDSCLAAQAALQSIDQLLVASYAKGTLSLRLLDVAGKRTVSEAKQDAVGAGEATASAEALACKLLVPAGCMGEVAADAAGGVQLELDGKPIAHNERRKISVGVHQLSARAVGQVAQRSLPVSREGAPSLYAQEVEGQLRILSLSEMAVPKAAVAVEAPPVPASKARWSKPVGFAVIGIGVAALAAGAIVGAMSHSDINSAESAFHANGGAYRTGDLNTLASGNSKAHSANALFVASGVLLAAGAVFTLAF